MNTATRATYNITDDRLKVWFAERLSPTEYADAKAAGFQWWPGSKCFSCVWKPQAEDFLARFGAEVEDIAEADDVAARVDRFARYAENAEETAEHAAARLENGDANTARRQRLAENVAAREFSTAAHWQRRISGAIRHAQHKENPGAIYRRIATLDTDLRRHERGQIVDETCTDGDRVWVGGNNRGQGSYIARGEVAEFVAWHKRWADHIAHRLEYERARLGATGSELAKLASNEVQIEKGGAIRLNRRRVCTEGWYLVTKVNPSSVEVYSPHEEAWRGPWRKIPRDEICEIGTPAQVTAGEIRVNHPPTAKPSSQPKGTAKARDGKTPEKFGAFGSSGGFCDKIEDCRWYLIAKVNRTTVEYLSKQQIQRADRSLYWSYSILKTEISGLSFVKTPAEVKAQHPDLLADWAKVEEIRARKAAAAKEAQPA
jgi:hypothetical protein